MCKFMKIDFREIELGRSTYEFDVKPAEVDFKYPEISFDHNIRASVSTLASGEEVIINGVVSTIATAECYRCLRTVELPLRANLRLIIQRTNVSGKADSGDDDFVVISKSEAQYDLAPHCREVLLVELPYKILCDINCKGLCPKCGTDLNCQECGCTTPKSGGQWEKLKDLIEYDTQK